MPVSSGYGTSVGKNFGGGGVINLVGVAPSPGSLATPSSAVQFTVSVSGDLVSLATVQVTISGEFAFDGSAPAFSSQYASSTYHYSATDNGYTFNVVRTGGWITDTVTVTVVAQTVQGVPSTHVFSFYSTSTVHYPGVPSAGPLNAVPLSAFTGEYKSGLLAGTNGAVFFSPALLATGAVAASVDVDNVEVRTHSAESYVPRQTDNSRPFVWGPPGGTDLGSPPFPPNFNSHYSPSLNNPNFTFLKTTGASVTGVLQDVTTGAEIRLLY